MKGEDIVDGLVDEIRFTPTRLIVGQGMSLRWSWCAHRRYVFFSLVAFSFALCSDRLAVAIYNASFPPMI